MTVSIELPPIPTSAPFPFRLCYLPFEESPRMQTSVPVLCVPHVSYRMFGPATHTMRYCDSAPSHAPCLPFFRGGGGGCVLPSP